MNRVTVIIFARATNGYVLASDGRTCKPGIPAHILNDDAKKIRTYHLGAGGFVTASSGRATIAGTSIADVEKSIFDEHHSSGSQRFGPTEFAQSIADVIEKHNSTQKCVCSTNTVIDGGRTCVMLPECAICEPESDCEHYEWYLQDDEGNGCPCAPFDKAPASTPSKYPTGCRCRPREEVPLSWICVPFGPDAGDAVTSTISAQYHPIPTTGQIKVDLLLQGELERPTRVDTDTIKKVDADARLPLTDIEKTAGAVVELLDCAYREAPDNVVVRQLEEAAWQVTTSTDTTIHEVADTIRKQIGTDDADLLAGAAGIGGTACVMVIENGKNPERLPTEDNYGLPVTVCPSHPDVVPCPSDLQP